MMRGRRRYRLALALGASGVMGALLGLALPSCYDIPKPECGFRCGPSGACPEDYTCAPDGRCHLNGSPASLVCGTPTDGPLVDAPVDAAVDTM
jgi:hypothetical protein